jgi:hypothetical protein
VRLVVPRAAVSLDHAGYLLRPSGTGVAVAAAKGMITLFDASLTRRTQLAATGSIEDVAWSPTARAAAVIDDEGLRYLELHRDHLRWRIVGKSYACHFTAGGEALWVARPATDTPGAWLELRDAGNGATLHKVHLPDPFGGSAFTLAPHPDPRGILVWIASPQTETRSIVVTVEAGRLRTEPLLAEEGYPPEPIPRSSNYLLVQRGILQRRGWSDHLVQDELDWPWLDDEDLAVLPISERFSLWASRAGRVHLIDHQEMSYVEEVAATPRPPRPLHEYLPESDDTQWGTDLQQFCTLGEQVVMQYGESSLLTLAVSDLLG